MWFTFPPYCYDSVIILLVLLNMVHDIKTLITYVYPFLVTYHLNTLNEYTYNTISSGFEHIFIIYQSYIILNIIMQKGMCIHLCGYNLC